MTDKAQPGEDAMASSIGTKRDQAQRVADALNRFVGTVHAARCTTAMWGHQVDNSALKVAAKYGMQMSFGAMALTLRKFQDLWNNHLCELLPEGSEGFECCKWILEECERRKLRTTANRLIAHYAAEKWHWPLSGQEIKELIESNGWNTEEEATEWGAPVVQKLIFVRDDVMRLYGITTLTDDEVTS